MFNKLIDTRIKDIHVVLQEGCEVIIETQTLRDIMRESPCKDRFIIFGVAQNGSGDLDISDDIFEPVSFQHNSNGVLYIDATRDEAGKRFPKHPKYFKIKLPCECRLHLFTG